MTKHMKQTDVVPVHLQLAARDLDNLAKTLERDVTGAFGRGMHRFTESSAGNYHDGSTPAGVRSGADRSWTNPLGTSDGAETYFQVLDDCRDSANKDAAALLTEMRAMAGLLRTVCGTYLKNEDEVTKQFVNNQFSSLLKNPPEGAS